jgi:hypothetical protein
MGKPAERTNPELWEKIKAELKRGSKGGKAGEWSASKAQLAVQEYKKRGGSYSGGKIKDEPRTQWAESDRKSKPGPKSGEGDEACAGREAVAESDSRVSAASAQGDSGRASRAPAASRPAEAITIGRRRGRDAQAHQADPSKANLLRQAKMLEIEGRSRMNKEDLLRAIRYAKH